MRILSGSAHFVSPAISLIKGKMLLSALINNARPTANLLIIPGGNDSLRSFISANTGKTFSTERQLPDGRRADIFIQPCD